MRLFFGGNASSALQVVVSADRPVSDPAVQRVVDRATGIVQRDARIAAVVPPQPGATISADGRTAIVLAGAKADPDTMVRAADDLKVPLSALSRDGVRVHATGASVLWSDFNTANHDAMMKSEIVSWPVTLAILVLAFGSLVAAGLPTDDGRTLVQALNPQVMVAVPEREKLRSVAEDAGTRIQAALRSLTP